MKILTLLENTTFQPELTPKHGLSLYIETGHCTGKKAFERLKELMKENIFEIKTGSRIMV